MRLASSAVRAAAIACSAPSRSRVVTAAMADMSFLQPVYIGDIRHVQATVNEAFGSSMEVGVRVDVEPLDGSDHRHVASAYLVFVALDERMRPAPVAPIIA